MPKKKIEFSKRHNSAYFKFSNQELFERREKEFLKNSKDKKFHKNINSYVSRNRYRNIKQYFLKEKNIFKYLKTLQFLDLSEKSSDKEFIKTISYNNENNLTQREKITNKYKNKFKSTNKFNDIFNITENGYMKHKRNFNSNINTKNYYTINDINKISIDNKHLIKAPKSNKKNINQNFTYKDKNIRKLLLIKNEKEINERKIDRDIKKKEKIKNLKLLKFNCTKEELKDYIEKFRLYNLTNYSIESKKERAVRLEETFNNQIEFYEYNYNSLLKSKKLFEKKYIIKITEYLKYLSIKIDKEKLLNYELLNKIRNIKEEIENLNSKIKKVENEKSNIIKWIYLQIQLKEKKLVLPDHYKTIFENNNIITNRKIKKKNTIRRKDTLRKKDNCKIYDNENKDNNFIDINGIKLDIKEYERINNYKKILIYKTPENFHDDLLSLENNNLKLIYYYDNLRNILFSLKKEFRKIKKDENDLDNYIKNKTNENKNEIDSLKSSFLSKINFSIDSKFNIYKKEEKQNKKSTLFIKVFKIYMNYKKGDNNNNNDNNSGNNIKITEEEEIINMLRYIEIKTDELIHKIYSIFQDNDKKSIQKYILKIKYEIEKEHKNEKAYLQKIKRMEKLRKLYEKIEERNNKIYFISKKKVDIPKTKIKIKIKSQLKTENQEDNKFEDF